VTQPTRLRIGVWRDHRARNPPELDELFALSVPHLEPERFAVAEVHDRRHPEHAPAVVWVRLPEELRQRRAARRLPPLLLRSLHDERRFGNVRIIHASADVMTDEYSPFFTSVA
jgi:hypothetical protein